MRLSEWRPLSPRRESLSAKVLAVLEPMLATIGAEPDPHVWISWGADPGIRYALLALTPGGVVVCTIRLNPAGDGPRIGAKLVRWSRVQIGDVDLETQQAHRLLTVQIEGQVLRGVDADADRVSRFVQAVLAGVDGRPIPSLDEPGRRRRASVATKPSTTRAAAKKAASKPVTGPRRPALRRATASDG
jgi:hypothetical protein